MPAGLDALELEGKRVSMRVDFNVPLDSSGSITDDTRIRAALPTIKDVQERGGRVVLMSHLGRPKGEVKEELRLDHVAARLQELLGGTVLKLEESTGPEVERAIETIHEGIAPRVDHEGVLAHPADPSPYGRGRALGVETERRSRAERNDVDRAAHETYAFSRMRVSSRYSES